MAWHLTLKIPVVNIYTTWFLIFNDTAFYTKCVPLLLSKNWFNDPKNSYTVKVNSNMFRWRPPPPPPLQTVKFTSNLNISTVNYRIMYTQMCFVRIWGQTAIISLYSINWLVFITETECVYCAVRTGSLYVILTFCPHSVFMCFVWIWEQTAIISLYSINWLVFITETECVYCAVRTGSLYVILTFCPHSVFMCFVRIWEQTAIISLHSINWLVFITETKCLYCAVRTEYVKNNSS